MASVVVPQSMASVLAIRASVESRKVVPSMAPASIPAGAPKNPAAPQAQAAAASIAPKRLGMR